MAAKKISELFQVHSTTLSRTKTRTQYRKVKMTLEQLKSEIRGLNPSDKIELCEWLDYETATDCSSSILSSRIGADRSREIRHTIIQIIKTNVPPPPREPGQAAGASLHGRNDFRFPGKAA